METDWAADIAHIERRRGTKECEGVKCRGRGMCQESMMRLCNATNSQKIETCLQNHVSLRKRKKEKQ